MSSPATTISSKVITWQSKSSIHVNQWRQTAILASTMPSTGSHFLTLKLQHTPAVLWPRACSMTPCPYSKSILRLVWGIQIPSIWLKTTLLGTLTWGTISRTFSFRTGNPSNGQMWKTSTLLCGWGLQACQPSKSCLVWSHRTFPEVTISSTSQTTTMWAHSRETSTSSSRRPTFWEATTRSLPSATSFLDQFAFSFQCSSLSWTVKAEKIRAVQRKRKTDTKSKDWR